jgi:cell wall-associated NlpC family hydrolase
MPLDSARFRIVCLIALLTVGILIYSYGIPSFDLGDGGYRSELAAARLPARVPVPEFKEMHEIAQTPVEATPTAEPTPTEEIRSTLQITITPTPLPIPKPAPQPIVITTTITRRIGADAMNLARAKVGHPYIWGGNGPDGFDCSGLIWWAYRQIGFNVPRTAETQYLASDPVNTLEPGDLLFLLDTSDPHWNGTDAATHVGIWTGTSILNAYNEDRGVIEQSLQDPYWVAHFAGARRLRGLPSTTTTSVTVLTPVPSTAPQSVAVQPPQPAFQQKSVTSGIEFLAQIRAAAGGSEIHVRASSPVDQVSLQSSNDGDQIKLIDSTSGDDGWITYNFFIVPVASGARSFDLKYATGNWGFQGSVDR